MPAAQRPEWGGRTVCCIASGPSLTREDCESVHAAGWPTIVCNLSFRMAPWADVLFGFDSKFWTWHMAEIVRDFKGRRVSATQLAAKLGLETTNGSQWFRQYPNSGACAVSFAIGAGAARVVLLGYDVGFSIDGRKHWHADHLKGNCASIKQWPKHFQTLAKSAGGDRVVNCSRETTLRCFPRRLLATELERDTVCA